MSAIFSFVTGKATQIFIVISLALVIGLFYQHIKLQNRNNEINMLNTQVSALEKDNALLESSLEKVNQAREAENKVLSKAREEMEKLKTTQQETLARVEDAFKDKNNTNIALPTDVSRMLANTCESVRGNPCPNP